MIAQHLRKRGHESVKPTVRLIRYWWARLNRLCFSGALLPCQVTFGVSDDPSPVEGLCYPLDGGRVRIHVDKRIDTRAGLLNVIAHEMVHQWQHQNSMPLSHGRVFKDWGLYLADHGLKI